MPNEPTLESLLAAIKARCDAGDVQRARRYFAKNPGNGMDDCAQWMESLCPTCANMTTDPALGNELDIFCEHALADVPRLLTLIEWFLNDGQDEFALAAATRILAGKEPDDG